MQQLKWILNGALFTLLFCLVVTLTILVMSEMQAVRADVVVQPAVTNEPLCRTESKVTARMRQQRVPVRGDACDGVQFPQHFVVDLCRVKRRGAQHGFFSISNGSLIRE